MIEYNIDTLQKLEDFIDKYLDLKYQEYKQKLENKKGEDSILRKIEHIRRTAKMAGIITDNNKLVIVAAKFHDIGRIPQYEILGGFRDDLILHHNLGEDLITRKVFKGELELSEELDIIRQSVMYHGRMRFVPFKESPITREASEITEIISEVDDIDNGCVGALGYIENEILTDAKNYLGKNPNLDMRSVSPRVFDFYSKGEKFNKLTECHTYADYLLFAAILAIQSLIGKNKKLAASLMEVPCFGYENALQGYKELFCKYVDPSLSLDAYNILYNYYELAKKDIVKGK